MATNKVIGKTTEVQRVQGSRFGVQERQRTAYSRQTVQERLPMSAVRATRQDSEDTTGGALVAGYTRRWLDRVVHVRASRESNVQPMDVLRNDCPGRPVCSRDLSP